MHPDSRDIQLADKAAKTIMVWIRFLKVTLTRVKNKKWTAKLLSFFQSLASCKVTRANAECFSQQWRDCSDGLCASNNGSIVLLT